MAKIYEALQRAEEERSKRVGREAPPVEPLSSPADGSRKSAGRRSSLLSRILRRGRREAEGGSDMNRRRFALLQPDSHVAEQFRTLRQRIDSLSSQRPIRTLAIASANPDEGKSTAAVNLALVTAMSVGREAVLVDCDFRRPHVQRSLGVEPKAGLAEVLLEEATLDEALVKVEGLNLRVLGIRAQPSNPSELLASPQMVTLVEELSRRFDRTIFDTPATLGLPDSKTVSDLCDGLLMVVRADHTPRADVEAALDILDRRRLLGLVLNGSDSTRHGYGYY